MASPLDPEFWSRSGGSNYDIERNERESGFGLGMQVYFIPDIITGGQQITLDASQQTIAPNTILEAAKNPSWLLVVMAAIMLVVVIARGK